MPEKDPRIRDRVDFLVNAMFLGNITEEEQQEFAQLVDSHDWVKDLFLRHAEIESVLNSRQVRFGESLAVSGAEPDGKVAQTDKDYTARNGGGIRSRTQVSVVLGSVAVSLALVCTVLLWQKFSADAPAAPAISVAEVTAVDGVSLDSGVPELREGERIEAGRLKIMDGVLRLVTNDNVQISLEGPVELEFLDKKTIRLFAGHLTANVPNEGIGFRVITPSADIVDMGTQFGVAVEDNGDSEVHVFDGVVVTRPLGREHVVPIYGDEAGRVNATRNVSLDNINDSDSPSERIILSDLVSIPLNRQRFRSAPIGPTDNPTPRNSSLNWEPLPIDARVAFISDWSLETHTHLLLMDQALENSGRRQRPKLINAYVPDSMQQYVERYEHHVLVHNPTHVVISFGKHVAFSTTPPPTGPEFIQALQSLCERVEQSGAEVILVTSYPFGSWRAKYQVQLDQYNTAIRDLAKTRRYRLADVDMRIQNAAAPDSFDRFIDGPTPSFEGARQVAAALLNAFGYRDAPVPDDLHLQLLPGVITNWKMRDKTKGGKLNAEQIRLLTVDDSWRPLAIPQQDPFADRIPQPGHSRMYQDRQLGFATHLTSERGPDIEAIATLHEPAERRVYFNTGAALRTVWLNGEKIYDRDEITFGSGWHAGKERIPATLRAGDNRVVIEAGHGFFLSVTDTFDW